MKIVYSVILFLLILLKLDLFFGEKFTGQFWAPKGEAAAVGQLTESIVKPWNFSVLENSIAPDLKQKMQAEGMEIFFNAISRQLGYVRSVNKAVYVPESLVSQWLHRGRLYRAEVESANETLQVEMRVRQIKGQIRLFEFAIESDSLHAVYEAAVKAHQNGIFDTKIFVQGLHGGL